MVRENNENIEDGAGDAMLARQEKEQLAQPNEVKFISAEHKNGDAKIDIGGLEKSFTGMTKEELMRYANDPFWVRLRWIFFILFWGLWVAMLVGAIYIIVGAPKCAAPQPLAWYKQGPLVKVDGNVIDESQWKSLESVGAKGVIFKLLPSDTYRVKTPEVADKIKELVASAAKFNIQVIFDVTPNYVSQDDELFVNAVANETQRSAFVFKNSVSEPNNWKAKAGSSAWVKNEATGQYVLSQFGENLFDLQLNNTLAKDRFKGVLADLVKLGVKGIRLENAVHFIINTDLKDEVENTLATGAVFSDYNYWTHTQTTYQAGLGELLNEFEHVVKNATEGTGFVSVTDHIVNPEALYVNGKLSFELPISGTLPRTLATGFTPKTVEQLSRELNQTFHQFLNASWLQWEYDTSHVNDGTVGLSEYNFFISLLPGVQVAHVNQLKWSDVANRTSSNITELQKLRETPSYMHGVFNVFTKNDTDVIAYTRIKTGNPGYFVAYNPSGVDVQVDFSQATGIAEQLTVNLFSANYNWTDIKPKYKVKSTEIPVSARSVIILTYVPKKDD